MLKIEVKLYLVNAAVFTLMAIALEGWLAWTMAAGAIVMINEAWETHSQVKKNIRRAARRKALAALEE